MKKFELEFALLSVKLRLEPDNATLYPRLLFAMELSGDYEQYFQLFLEITDQQPYNALAWYHLGMAALGRGLVSDAMNAFEYAFIADPHLTEAYYAYVELALEAELPRTALYCLQELERYVPANARLWLRIAECYRQLEEIDLAEANCKSALAASPDCAEAAFLLGLLHMAKGSKKLALQFLRKAVLIDPQREDFHRALAKMYADMKMHKKASEHFWRAIDLAPDDAALWLESAMHLLGQQHTSAALKLINEALLYVDHVDLHYGKAACLFLLQRREEAWKVLDMALRQKRQSPAEFFRLAPALQADVEIWAALAA